MWPNLLSCQRRMHPVEMWTHHPCHVMACMDHAMAWTTRLRYVKGVAILPLNHIYGHTPKQGEIDMAINAVYKADFGTYWPL